MAVSPSTRPSRDQFLHPHPRRLLSLLDHRRLQARGCDHCGCGLGEAEGEGVKRFLIDFALLCFSVWVFAALILVWNWVVNG
jgi:hypothetical protein